MTTRITVDLEEITWGELIAFVDAARAIQVSESDKVIQISDLLDDVTVTAFELILPRPLPQNWRSVSSELAEEIRTILTLISQGDGDIRELLPQVRALNDSLS